MSFFKKKTSGNIVVMGKKTWDSLPRKPLSNRLNIIITSKLIENTDSIIFITMEDFIK